MPYSNPGPLPQKSGALPMSHHISLILLPVQCAARAEEVLADELHGLQQVPVVHARLHLINKMVFKAMLRGAGNFLTASDPQNWTVKKISQKIKHFFIKKSDIFF